MKKGLLLTMMLYAGALVAQVNPTKADLTQIFQKCIDMPALEQYYARDNAGDFKPLIIVYGHPSLIPTDLVVVKNGRTVQLKETNPSVKPTEDHFEVVSLSVDQTQASVQLDFNKQTDNGQRKIRASIDLQKIDGNWTIINSVIKN